MPIPEVLNPAVNPAPRETLISKELLNKGRVGLQGALLLDGVRPGVGVNLNKDDLQKVKSNIESGQFFETTKITNGSKQERDDYWKNSEHKDKKFEEQKEIWITNTDKFLEGYNEAGKEKEKEILGKLGMKAGEASGVYDEYFGKENGKGDIGYFATKVANKLESDEIEKYSGLLETIGGFYGKDSAEVAKLLAEGAKNLKENAETFIPAAELSFNNNGLSDEDRKILQGVYERSGKRETDQKQKEAEEKLRQEAAKKAAVEEAERKRKELENKPKPEVQSEKEKEIRALMEPLLKFHKEIREKATDITFSFDDKYTEEEIEKIEKTEWGPKMIGDYQKNFDLLSVKINEAVKAGDATIDENVKFSELNEGDIFAEKGNEDDNVLIFKGKAKKNIGGQEKNVYSYHILGKDLEFLPHNDVSEEDSKDMIFQKLVFVNKAQKPEEIKEPVQPTMVTTGEKPHGTPEEDRDKAVKVEKEIRETMQSLLNFENQMKAASQDHNLDFNVPSQRVVALNSVWGLEMMAVYNKSYREMKIKLDEAIKTGLLIHIPSKSGALAVGDIIDLSDKGGPDALRTFQGKDDKGYNFRQFGPGKELAPNIAFEFIEDQEFQKIGFGGPAQKPEEVKEPPPSTELKKETPQQATVTTVQENVSVVEPRGESEPIETVTSKERAQLNLGESVILQRNENWEEEGWKIKAIDSVNKVATVEKTDDKGTKEEEVPLNQLKRLDSSKTI